MASALAFVLKHWKIFLTAGLTVLALIILWPSMERVASWFGYETRDQIIKDRDQARKDVDTAVDANKEQSVTIKILEDTTVNIEKTLTSLSQDKIKRITKFNAAVLKKIDRIQIIANDSSMNEGQKDKQISQIQIESLWEIYCEYNDAPECQTNAPSHFPTGPIDGSGSPQSSTVLDSDTTSLSFNDTDGLRYH